MKTFPIGALVLLDGRYVVRVVDVFPEGSTSYLFPHYVIKSKGSRVVVKLDRISVKLASTKP